VINLRIAGCQKEDRDLREIPNLSAEIEASEVGQANIEHCKVGGVIFEVIKPGLCGRDVSDREILGFECIDQSVRYGGLIFDEKD
jgi:hypothetical protein